MAAVLVGPQEVLIIMIVTAIVVLLMVRGRKRRRIRPWPGVQKDRLQQTKKASKTLSAHEKAVWKDIRAEAHRQGLSTPKKPPGPTRRKHFSEKEKALLDEMKAEAEHQKLHGTPRYPTRPKRFSLLRALVSFLIWGLILMGFFGAIYVFVKGDGLSLLDNFR